MDCGAVSASKKRDMKQGRRSSPEQAAAAAMVAAAREQGLELTGPDGLLKLFTKNVLETALNEEMTEHLGYEKNRAEPGRETSNIRNGSRPKTVISDAVGAVEIGVPRDRDATFEPQIVRKRQRRLGDVDQIVLSLYAKGLTTGEISAHFDEIYGASVSKETISRITEAVVAEMDEWSSRPLESTYVALFIDAIVVKVRDGQVANRPVYAVIGVTVDGRKDVLGLWMGTGEGAKFWMSVLVDLKNRGVKDVFFLVCDGLKGLPEVVENIWPLTIVQTCLIHLLRNSFRLVSKKYWDALKRDLKPIYTASNADAALAALDDLEEKWGQQYGAMIRLRRNSWEQFTPFLAYDVEIRKVLCSTNAIESLNARYRRAVRARGHFPTEQAAMKCLYLVTRSLDPTGTGRTRWTMRWKPVINAMAITFSDRWPVAETS
jgi:putative transposase